MSDVSRQHAMEIWRAAVEAVRPERCLPQVTPRVVQIAPEVFRRGGVGRILVVGGGKAGLAMARVWRKELEHLGIEPERVVGWVNVPGGEGSRCEGGIELWSARPHGINQPTAEAVAGTERILELAASAAPQDVLVCLLSGGGSALLPAPVARVSLQDKQAVTALLHRCGATIQEMNTVRKHLSRIKGGGLIRHFRGQRLISLIISDVIGDPLDVIASGPTATDPTTFQDALEILDRYGLTDQVPEAVLQHLRRGAVGLEPETLKSLPTDPSGQPRVHNLIVANNDMALEAAARHAGDLGYRVLNLGSWIEGETRQVAAVLGDIALGQLRGTCLLCGGETTVTLPQEHGLGGRNMEFVAACMQHLYRKCPARLADLTILSGGTDGEDGPTDAAGAVADADTAAHPLFGELSGFLQRHDTYSFFAGVGGLLKTGLTGTNVMDVRIILT
jgi:hydroxypyruvate reductase/glycerate 2-kinase